MMNYQQHKTSINNLSPEQYIDMICAELGLVRTEANTETLKRFAMTVYYKLLEEAIRKHEITYHGIAPKEQQA